tara:strand:+ start:148 stop:417 length:270 start_codon:yes stop_codon:yes gene_type:complete
MVEKDEWFNTLKTEEVEKILPALAVAGRAGLAAAKTPMGKKAIGAAGNFAAGKMKEKIEQQKQALQEQKKLQEEQKRLQEEQERMSQNI